MIPYILIFVIVFSGFLTEQFSSKSRFFIYWTIIILVALMVGLRDMIGGYDVFIYAKVFEQTPPLDLLISSLNYYSIELGRFETGYILVNSVIKLFATDKYFFFFIVSLISYFFIAKSFSDLRFRIAAFFVFFSKFFIVSFVYQRQFIAMGIVFIAIKYLIEEKKILFIFLILVASTIHLSALTIMPLLFLCKIKYSNTHLFVIYISALIIGISPVMKTVLFYISEMEEFDKAATYAITEQSAIHIMYLIESTFLIITTLMYRNDFTKDKRSLAIFNVLVLYIVFTLLVIRDSGLNRIPWYYSFGYCIMLPQLFMKLIKNKFMTVIVLLLFCSFLFFRNVLVRDGGNNVPYKAIFMNTQRHNIHE